MNQEPVLHDYKFNIHFSSLHRTRFLRKIVVVNIKIKSGCTQTPLGRYLTCSKTRRSEPVKWNWEIIGIEKEYIRDRQLHSCNSQNVKKKRSVKSAATGLSCCVTAACTVGDGRRLLGYLGPHRACRPQLPSTPDTCAEGGQRSHFPRTGRKQPCPP